MIAILLDRGPSDTSSAVAIQGHFYDAHVRVELSALFWSIAVCFLLVFVAAFATRVRSSEIKDASLLASVVIPAGAVLAGLQLGGEAAWFTLARQPAGAVTGLHEAWLYHDLGDSFFALENLPAFLIVAVGAIVAARALLPRWVAWVSLLSGALLLVNAFVQLLANDSGLGDPLGIVAQVVFLVWLLSVAAAWRDEPHVLSAGTPAVA